MQEKKNIGYTKSKAAQSTGFQYFLELKKMQISKPDVYHINHLQTEFHII